jgi:iron complex outermembrane receptor protein
LILSTAFGRVALLASAVVTAGADLWMGRGAALADDGLDELLEQFDPTEEQASPSNGHPADTGEASAKTQERGDPGLAEQPLLDTIRVDSAEEQRQPLATRKPRTSGVVEEIVVTAQRKAESLRDVPMAISAFSADQLESAGVESTDDLTALTPGLQIGSVSGSALVYMRGIGNINVVTGSESSNAFYLDNVYYAESSGVMTSFSNVERVEILKGPQGTLYGRNATGGLIHVITPAPQQEFLMNGKLGYESYDTKKGSFYITGGLQDSLSASFAANVTDQGRGYGRNLTLDEEILFVETQNYRAKLLWEPGASDDITLTGSYFRNPGDNGLQGSNYPGHRSLSGATYSGAHNSQAGERLHPRTDATDVSLVWDHAFKNEMLFKSISAYRDVDYLVANSDADDGALDLARYDFSKDQYSFQQELLLQGGFDLLGRSIDFTSGVFYFENQITFGLPLVIPVPSLVDSILDVNLLEPLLGSTALGSTVMVDQYSRTYAESIAVYSQVDVELTDRDTLTVGLRYTHDQLGEDVSEFFNGIPGGTAEGESKYGQLTWRLAFRHHFADAWMAFASFSRGYKSGLFNGVGDGSYLALLSNLQTGIGNIVGTTTVEPVRPELLDAFELGTKTTLLDGGLQLGANLFFYDYQDLQITTTAVVTPNLRNAAQAKIYGVELESVWAAPVPLGDLLLNGNFGYLENEFTSFPDCNFWRPIPVVGGNLAAAADCTGNRLPYSSKFEVTLGVTYTTPYVLGGHFGLAVNYYYNDGFFLNTENTQVQDAYNTVNAELSYTFLDERARLRAFGRNLTDERVWLFCSLNNFASSCRARPPRQVGVSVEYTWGE